ncbi:MAG: sterol desaturase family protein [Thermodesulfobacteriota bacterium]
MDFLALNIQKSPELFRGILFWGGILFFLIIESTIPYRPASVSKVKRWMDNLSLAIFNALILNLIFFSSILNTATYVTENRLGVLHLWSFPEWTRILATLVFMDLALYIWHLLNHEVPFLWRFHRVHHSDLNLDVSSASRFHIGELSISAVIKIGIIFFLGADYRSIAVFESMVVLTSQFHHSSLTLPVWVERLLWVLFVPPSMHRIHHSVIIRERNTNYGTIFSFWDRIFETILSAVDQKKIRIGIGAYPRFQTVRFRHLLKMPFTKGVR